jgi:hypothetical protein
MELTERPSGNQTVTYHTTDNSNENMEIAVCGTSNSRALRIYHSHSPFDLVIASVDTHGTVTEYHGSIGV